MVSIGRPSPTLLLGPAKSGKTKTVLEAFAAAGNRAGNVPSFSDIVAALLLVPSRAEARRLRERLTAQGKPFFASGIVALEDLAQSILEKHGIMRPGLDEGKRLWLLRGIVSELSAAGKLRVLKDMADNEGFLEQLADFFAELKHAEIFYPQLKEGLRRKGPDPKDAEILEMYAEYQRVLVEHDLFDQEGILWKAKAFLEKAAATELPRALWVDGFETFSPAQIEFLKALARKATEICVTLTMKKDTDREALFGKAQETRKALVAALGLKEVWQSPVVEASGPQALCSHLFRPDTATAHISGVTLHEAPTLLQEVRWCAAEIKRRLGQDLRAMRDIAVCARRLDAYRETIKQEFLRHGIPLRMADLIRMDRIPLGRFMLAFLRAHAAMDTQTLLTILHSGLLKHPTLEDLNAERLECALKIGGIREFSGEWQKRLAYVSKDSQLAKRVEKILAALGAWPKQQTLRAHWETLCAQWRAWGIPEQTTDTDQANALSQALEEYGSLVCGFGKDRPIPLTEFIQDFSRFLHYTQWQARQNTQGVAVLEAHAMRGASFDTVFLLGLNEGLFPSLGERRALHSPRERQHMQEAGIFLQDEGKREAREAFLFYRVVASARRSLWACWHKQDSDVQECLPSSYYKELQRLAGKSPQKQDALKNIRNPSHWASPEDALAALGLNLFSGKTRRPEYFPELLRRWEIAAPDRTANLKRRADMERQRQFRHGFSPFDGQFREKALLNQVARKMGPGTTTSASRLGEYAKCPFRFYSKYLLQIDPPGPRRTELDAREQGILLHDILWRLYHRHFQEKHHATVGEAFQKMVEDAPALAAQVFAGFEQTQGILQPAVWNWEKRRLTEGMKDLLRYEEIFFTDHPGRVPAYFELSFGPLDKEGADPASRPEPVTLRLGNQKLKLRGRIDRVDLEHIALPDGRTITLYWILDYKSGHPAVSPKKIRSGQDVQLPLYLLATEAMLEGLGIKAIPAGAGILEILPPKTGGKFHKKMKIPKGVLEDPSWDKDLADAKEWIFRHAEDIGRGRFTPTPNPECEVSCPYRSICRFDEQRIARKIPVSPSGVPPQTPAAQEAHA